MKIAIVVTEWRDSCNLIEKYTLQSMESERRTDLLVGEGPVAAMVYSLGGGRSSEEETSKSSSSSLLQGEMATQLLRDSESLQM